MSDMRLIVAGAGGRMGRTLIEAISDTDGAVLVGAVEAADSAAIGRDAGELAGLGVNGILVTRDDRAAARRGRRRSRFHRARRDRGAAGTLAQARPRPRHRHHRAFAGPGEGDRGRRCRRARS